MQNTDIMEKKGSDFMELYHYCSVAVMQSIIENKFLRLSSAIETNDKTEYKYFEKALEEYAGTTKTESVLIKNAVKEVVRQATSVKREKYRPYICCLSKEKDLLSQWRGYGDDGRGVAIRFDFEKTGQFVQKSNMNKIETAPFITEIEYAETERIKSVPIVFHNMLSYVAVANPTYEETYKLGVWQAAVASISLKHFGFLEEQEYRIVWLDNGENHPDVQEEFCTRNGELKKCFHFNLDVKNAVKEIILGPKCKMKKDDPEFVSFLESNNLQDVKISESSIPYC